MKKLIVLILMLSYMVSSSGATVYVQQCMGKTIGWSLTDKDGSQCTRCGMSTGPGHNCCQEQVRVLKVHNDQNLPKIHLEKILVAPTPLPPFFNAGAFPAIVSQTARTVRSYTPLRQNYCILYCTFLI